MLRRPFRRLSGCVVSHDYLRRLRRRVGLGDLGNVKLRKLYRSAASGIDKWCRQFRSRCSLRIGRSNYRF
ncbi:MAG: hypothetical protein D6725_00275 [Planctomycetota bacterium]|nr:MAG: hypothetical protein D6725_00275 [Planctomycetota bacterium]